jgi:hypothetical protein
LPVAARAQQSDHVRRIAVLLDWDENDPSQKAEPVRTPAPTLK